MKRRPIRVLPLEPFPTTGCAVGNLHLPVIRPEDSLSSSGLAGIERAALALLEAVRSAKGGASAYRPAGTPVVSVVEAANEFLIAKAKAGRSQRYLKVALAQLRAFATGREAQPLGSVTAAEIEKWLYAREWQPKTQRGYLLTVRTLFNFAAARLHIVGNPALGVDLPTLEDREPEIHTPAQVKAVLEKARELDPSLCRWMAIRYFAGLRGSEAESLVESEMDGEHIEVKAAKAKTRQRRLVKIEPALTAWLAIGGELPLRQVNQKHWDLIRAMEFPCPQNVTRHSFVSYHLAQFNDAARTALEAGHTQEMVFRNYRKVVTPAAAAEFWGIRPAG